jgi:hypothetical protein
MALPVTITMTQRRTSTKTTKDNKKGAVMSAPFFLFGEID